MITGTFVLFASARLTLSEGKDQQCGLEFPTSIGCWLCMFSYTMLAVPLPKFHYPSVAYAVSIRLAKVAAIRRMTNMTGPL